MYAGNRKNLQALRKRQFILVNLLNKYLQELMKKESQKSQSKSHKGLREEGLGLSAGLKITGMCVGSVISRLWCSTVATLPYLRQFLFSTSQGNCVYSPSGRSSV